MPKPFPEIKQTSMTEWFSAMGDVQDSETFRQEDMTKVDRLTFLAQTMKLPYRVPFMISAEKVVNNSEEYAAYQQDHMDDRVAFRVVPSEPKLEKIRQRGLFVGKDAETWLASQKIDFSKYTVQIFPDEDRIFWSTSFVVSENGIFGDVCEGWHSDLSAGEGVNPIFQFSYDFKNWEIFGDGEKKQYALVEAKRAVECVLVPNEDIQQQVSEKVTAKFTRDYLVGYFETIVPPDGGVYFNDYNQTLGKFVKDQVVFGFSDDEAMTLKGIAVSKGSVSGHVVVVDENNLGKVEFPENAILVCRNTNVDYLPYMQKASAIVTDIGSTLSHAAIVARELKKPCIVATKNATVKFQTGDLVEVDANKGIVRKLS